jgi:hypothetical protein
MAPPNSPETPSTSGNVLTRFAEHLARSETDALATLLGPSTVELLGKLGPDATTSAGLAYFVVSLYGKRGALRRRDIRGLLLSTLNMTEATDLCHLLQLPAITPLQTLSGLNFDVAPGNLELLERWYGLVDDDVELPLEASEGSHKAIASHKLRAHQLNAFRKLRRAIAEPPCSVLVHMPFGAGKLRLVATAALDLYRSETDDRSVIWLAPGPAMCEEAFVELQEVWRQLGSRDTTIFRLYGDHPTRDLDQLGGAISVIDILRLRKDDPALERLGSVASVAVLADAENLVHPFGAEIVRRMSAGGPFSVIGILASSGEAISEGPARSTLKAAFSGPCITVAADEELQALRDAGDFVEIQASVVHLTGSASTSPLFPANDESLDFNQAYAGELGNIVERNEHLLEILKNESAGRGRIIFYATTAENARLFAGLLPVLGVKARSVTADESPAERTLALQKFVARDERVLCVHGFLLSGLSVPDISVCVVASPCKSRATFLSMIGRLVQARPADLPTLRLIVAADSQADAGWVESLSTWSTLST